MSAEESLKHKAMMAGVPYGALQMVYNRGIGAWKTNPESVRLRGSGRKTGTPSRAGKMGKEQWAHARTNAFLEKRPSVFYGADKDIKEKYGLK